MNESVRSELETALVPSPRGYRTLVPPGYHNSLPLLLLLHGGGGSSEFLVQMQPMIEQAWASGSLPPLAVATLDAERSFYLDYADGSERWETFVLREWLPHLRETLPVDPRPAATLIAGISMGGHGTIRIGLRYPEEFVAMAAMEPAVMPALTLAEVPAANLEFQQSVLEARYGSPPDAWWNVNNPAHIAEVHAESIRATGIAIYLEVGTDDFLLLNEGTDFLHTQLNRLGISHEYRQVLGANHVGRTVAPRFLDMLGFLGRALADPEPDAMLEQVLATRAAQNA